MATRTYVKHRKVRIATLKKSKSELCCFNKSKAVGAEKGSLKPKTDSFKAALIQTRGLKFNREEANSR